jgi:acylphosphatase
MPADTRTVLVRIEGRVQGVGYRAWVEGEAFALALGGWVRNRRNGSVEAVFHGPAEHVAEVLERCKRGPSAAKVTSVEVQEEGGGTIEGFTVRPTV